jgi:hypothetical protein
VLGQERVRVEIGGRRDRSTDVLGVGAQQFADVSRLPDAAGGVGSDQALGGRGGEHRLQRHQRVFDRRLRQPLALLLLVGQPRHEPRHRVRRDLHQLQPRAEERQRVVLQQPLVLATGVLAEAAAAAALVLVDPAAHVLADRDFRVGLDLSAGDVGSHLGPPLARVALGAERALALLPGDAHDGDVALAALEDAGGPNALHLRGRHQPPPRVSWI